ncbi:MAG: hypothetical protein ACYDD9_09395 [Acidithiobacillus sp.]
MKLRWLFLGIYFCLTGCGDTTPQAFAKCEMKEQQSLSYASSMGICMRANGFIPLHSKSCNNFYAFNDASCYTQQGYLGGLNQQLLKIL